MIFSFLILPLLTCIVRCNLSKNEKNDDFRLIYNITKPEHRSNYLTSREVKEARQVLDHFFRDPGFMIYDIFPKDWMVSVFNTHVIPETFGELETRLWLDRGTLRKWAGVICDCYLTPKIRALANIERKGLLTTDLAMKNNVPTRMKEEPSLHIVLQDDLYKMPKEIIVAKLGALGVHNTLFKQDIIGFQIFDKLQSFLKSVSYFNDPVRANINLFPEILSGWFITFTKLNPRNYPILVCEKFVPILEKEFIYHRLPFLNKIQELYSTSNARILTTANFPTDGSQSAPYDLRLVDIEEIERWYMALEAFPMDYRKQSLPYVSLDNRVLVPYPSNRKLHPNILKYSLYPQNFVNDVGRSTTLVPIEVSPERGECIFHLYSSLGEITSSIFLRDLPRVSNKFEMRELMLTTQRAYLSLHDLYKEGFARRKSDLSNLELGLVRTRGRKWKMDFVVMGENVGRLCRRGLFCSSITEFSKHQISPDHQATILDTRLLRAVHLYYSSTLWSKALLVLKQYIDVNEQKPLVPLLESTQQARHAFNLKFLDTSSKKVIHVVGVQNSIFNDLKNIIDSIPEKTAPRNRIQTTYKSQTDGTYGLTAYFLFQIMYSKNQLSYASNASMPLRISLEAQRLINTAQLAGDGVEKLAQLKSIIIHLANVQSLGNIQSRLPSKSIFGHMLGLPADIAFLAASGVEWAYADSPYEKVIFKTQFGVASVNLATSGLTKYLSLIGRTAVAESISMLSVPMAGVSIGMTFLAEAMARVLQKIEVIAKYFELIESDYSQKGVSYNESSRIFQFLPNAVIKRIDLKNSQVEFDSQYIYSMVDKGITISINTDKSQALNIRKEASIIEDTVQVENILEAGIIILPFSPKVYINYNYQWVSPFFDGKEYPGVSLLRKLEVSDRFAFTYWSVCHFAIHELYFEAVETIIDIILDSAFRKLVIPSLDSPSLYLEPITYRFHGNQGRYHLVLNYGPEIILVDQNNSSAEWFIDASFLKNAVYSIRNSTLFVENIKIDLTNVRPEAIHLMLNDQSVHRLTSQSNPHTIIVFEAQQTLTDVDAFLNNFSQASRPYPNYIIIPNYVIDGIQVGTCYYFPENRQLAFTQDLELSLTENAHLLFFSPSMSCFFNKKQKAVWFTHVDNHFTTLLAVRDSFQKSVEMSALADAKVGVLIYILDETRRLVAEAKFSLVLTKNEANLLAIETSLVVLNQLKRSIPFTRDNLEVHLNLMMHMSRAHENHRTREQLSLSPYVQIHSDQKTNIDHTHIVWIYTKKWKAIYAVNKSPPSILPKDLALLGGIANTAGTSETYYFYSFLEKCLYYQHGANENETQFGVRKYSIENVTDALFIHQSQELIIVSNSTKYRVQEDALQAVAVCQSWFYFSNKPTLEKLRSIALPSWRTLPISELKVSSQVYQDKPVPAWFLADYNKFAVGLTLNEDFSDYSTEVSQLIGVINSGRYALLYDGNYGYLTKRKMLNCSEFIALVNNKSVDVLEPPERLPLEFTIIRVEVAADGYHLFSEDASEWVLNSDEKLSLVGIQANESTTAVEIRSFLEPYPFLDSKNEVIAVHYPVGITEWYHLQQKNLTRTNSTATSLIGIDSKSQPNVIFIYVYDATNKQLFCLSGDQKHIITMGIDVLRVYNYLLMTTESDQSTNYPSILLDGIDVVIMVGMSDSDTFRISDQMWNQTNLILIGGVDPSNYQNHLLLPSLDLVVQRDQQMVNISDITNTTRLIVMKNLAPAIFPFSI